MQFGTADLRASLQSSATAWNKSSDFGGVLYSRKLVACCPGLRARITELIDNTPQQSHNPSQQPRNLAQQIYAFHFNPRQMLRKSRHISVVFFAVQN
jgi:hypothetical protein